MAETSYKVRLFDRIKNLQRAGFPGDFRLNPLAVLVLAAFLAAGLTAQLALTPGPPVLELAGQVAAVLVFAALLAGLPSWTLVLALLAVFWTGGFARYGSGLLILRAAVSLGLLLAPAAQVSHHWEKAVILRLGRFHRLRGPGVFLLLPFADRVTRFVDTRIRATDFSAEKTITIEITDTIIPAELEGAMSKRAQAERERQSRVILGTAEVEISEKFLEAAKRYQDNPTALHLRGMNMIYEGIKQHGTIVLLPSGALSSMSLSGVLDELAQGKLSGDKT